jgi:hypothetical protein
MKFFLASVTGVLALGMCLALPAAAQPSTGGPAPSVPIPDPSDPTAVPLDGGASLLLAGGVAYGIRQIRARQLARRIINKS